jgi:putative ABC transport system permease protein
MFTALTLMAARIRALFSRDRFDRDFEQELESHVAMLTDDNIKRGMTREEARRAALIRVGGRASLEEQHRQVRGLAALETIAQDLRFSFRLIGRERWFSAAAIVALALGIGVNATGFTIVNAAFLRGLPFEDAGRLYMLSWQPRERERANVSFAELQDWRAQSRTFSGIAAFTDDAMNISDDRTWPEQVSGAQLTANAFGVLRQQPLLGRGFAPDDERAGAEPVVVIGYDIWKNRYGSDPHVLGRALRVDGQPATIVGVMPEGMRFPVENAELWVPFIPTHVQKRRDSRPLSVFGRLNQDATRGAAQAELNGIAQQLARAYPETSKQFVGVRLETFTERFVGGPARVMFLAMMGAVSLVLLIACANVANLLLSRSEYRAREIAVRMALGATRVRIVRQLMIESVVLGFIGGGLGLLGATAGVRMFDAAVQDPGKPFWIVFKVDYMVFAYVAATCVLTAILFGLAPAVQVANTGSNQVLKESGRGSVGRVRARWFSSGTVVAELALSLVLLGGAGLMVRSFISLYTMDVGFPTDHLTTVRMRLPDSQYANADARLGFFERLEARLAAVPGVEAVALTTGVPPFDGGERRLQIDRTTAESGEQLPFVSIVTIGPRFYEVLRVPLIRGRSFDSIDGAAGRETVIINERLATEFFHGQDPIGRRLRFARRETTPDQAASPWRTIIGVAPSIRHGSPQDAYLNAVVYVPYRQEAPNAASLMIRSGLAPGSVLDAVRREVQAIDRDQPVFTIQTLDQMLAESRWAQRVFGSSFAIFAGIALVLSTLGLYAVMAYSVSQRTQEIGIRMALGAQAPQVIWLILKRGFLQLAIGLTLGLAGALALSRVLRGLLVEITPNDPVTFAAITILLTVVSIAACLLPARQATRIDPLVALRAE